MQERTRLVVELLNEVLTAELTAINQYFLHAELCANWGFKRLYGIMRAHSIDEMKHAETLIERILFLGGLPNVQRMGNVQVGESVSEQLDVDHGLETVAVERLGAGIVACNDSGDHGTRLILEQMLQSEEEHIEWIDEQRTLIEQVGLERYLAEQINPAA